MGIFNPASFNPAGATTEVQYNNAGVFGSSSNFTFNSGTNTLSVGHITGSALEMTIQPRAPTVLEDAGTLRIVGRNAVKANSNGGSLSFISGNRSGSGQPGTINFSITGSGTTLALALDGFSAIGNVGESFSSTTGNFVFTGQLAGNSDQPMQFFAGGNLAFDGNTPIEFYTDSGTVFQVGETTFGTQEISFFGSALAPKQVITGSRVANPALASLLTALDTIGLITNSSTV